MFAKKSLSSHTRTYRRKETNAFLNMKSKKKVDLFLLKNLHVNEVFSTTAHRKRKECACAASNVSSNLLATNDAYKALQLAQTFRSAVKVVLFTRLTLLARVNVGPSGKSQCNNVKVYGWV